LPSLPSFPTRRSSDLLFSFFLFTFFCIAPLTLPFKTPPAGGWGVPGFARRVRTAYSRTLCLPCLKAGFFCFLHYRCWPLYVQLLDRKSTRLNSSHVSI